MKNIVMMIVSVMIGVLTLAVVMSVSGKMNRSMEIKSSLSSAIESTVEHMLLEAAYESGQTDEYVSDFTQNLAVMLDTKSDITVEVLGEDEKKGVLSIRVKEAFQYPNGKTGIVTCDRTVILNRGEEHSKRQCSVKFYQTRSEMESDLNCFKYYIVQEGDVIHSPAGPSLEGKHFMGWMDLNDYIADFSLPVTQDVIYYADWR